MNSSRRKAPPGRGGGFSGDQIKGERCNAFRMLIFVLLYVILILVYHEINEGDLNKKIENLRENPYMYVPNYNPRVDTSNQANDKIIKYLKDPVEFVKELGVESFQAASKESLSALQTKLYYWKVDHLTRTGADRLPSSLGDKYVLFQSDCGGFNNIRMAFEYFVFMAWLTKRTLVLPPPEPWYLIDNGPMARMKSTSRGKSVTEYNDFFDIESLRSKVPVISAQEFVRREASHLQLPEILVNADLKTEEGRKIYKSYVYQKTDFESDKTVSLPWAPLSHIIYYPSINAVEEQFPPHSDNEVPKNFIHHRKIIEFDSSIVDKPVMLFPSCKKHKHDDFRYLVQVNTIAAFADEALSRSYKRMLRDNVHYQSIVFDVAARVIQYLGPFDYAALHIRRNDLQYKEVFIDASSTLENIKPLLKGTKKLYVATDETKFDEFFQPFKDHGIELFHWDDFFTSKGGNVLKNVFIPRKLEGCIEQVICALAKVFAGTLESTFTSYIYRLRGYYHAPNTETYFHNLKYTGNVKHDRAKTYSRKPPKGTIYKNEHPSIWEDTELPHTQW